MEIFCSSPQNSAEIVLKSYPHLISLRWLDQGGWVQLSAPDMIEK